MADVAVPADPYLRNWIAVARSVTAEARRLFDELAPEQMLWKPAPTVWSAAECFQHLVASAELYHPRIEKAVGELPETPAGVPFRARWLQRRFIAAIGPQAKRRMKAPRALAPASAEIDVASLEREFFARQDELAELILRSDGLDLNRVALVSPLLRILRWTLGEAFWMLTAHSERHLLQARRLLQAPGFPAG